MKGLARGCRGKQELGSGSDFQAPLPELSFSHFCAKLWKISALPGATLQLEEIQLQALTSCRDCGIAAASEVSFWQVGITRWHLHEALDMTSAAG